jgi:thiamine-phosphate pyrophosphorylase
MTLPRLYAIVDAGSFASAPDPASALADFARELFAAGVTLVQYRNKKDAPPRQLADARTLRRLAPEGVRLIMNDRADLALAAGFDGVHVGQDDLSPAAARRVLGDRLWVGVSTHSVEQVREADGGPADYLAIGPVFATATKSNPDPVVGLEGIRAARASTRKPLVAIGGITRANCCSVLDNGADSVAVISDLLDAPRKSAEAFLRLLG